MRKGMVFGVFDGFHEGHKHFLKEAASRCDALTVVVARDAAARALKGRAPKFALPRRLKDVSSFDSRLSVVPGDELPGSWKILETEKPDIVILGYDQQAIAAELDSRAILYIYVTSHEPEKYKSSILNL